MQVTNLFSPVHGGSAEVPYYLSRELAKRGHEVAIYTSDFKLRQEYIIPIPEVKIQAFNFASETETKVIDIANMVNEITGNRNGVEFVARRDWDKIVRRRASIEKARRVLGYELRTEMKEGIKRTYDWMENRDKIEASTRF